MRVLPVSSVKRPVPSTRKRRPGRLGDSGLCATRRAGERCAAGRGRQTAGGGDKVSHAGWPAVTGILWKVVSEGRGHRSHTGGPDNDELLGHHGHDRINGMGGDDILWGDWDPKHNNTTQHDTLRGGAGNDWLYPSHGTSKVYGGTGADHAWAFYGHGLIDCGPGQDTVRVRPHTRWTLRSCERVEHFGAKHKGAAKQKATRPR
jgi:hypothetical protein